MARRKGWRATDSGDVNDRTPSAEKRTAVKVTGNRTVKIGKLRRRSGIAKGKAVRSLKNVRRVPKGTDTRAANAARRRMVGTIKGRLEAFGAPKYGPNMKQGVKRAAGGVFRTIRALIGRETVAYRFRRQGAVGSRQG